MVDIHNYDATSFIYVNVPALLFSQAISRLSRSRQERVLTSSLSSAAWRNMAAAPPREADEHGSIPERASGAGQAARAGHRRCADPRGRSEPRSLAQGRRGADRCEPSMPPREGDAALGRTTFGATVPQPRQSDGRG